MHVNQILNCSFEKWYPLFKNLTFKSEIIPIPDEVVKFLRSNSTIILPKSCQDELDLVLKKDRERRKKDFDTDSEDEKEWKDEEEETKPEYPDFPEFDKHLTEALSRLGNKIFIKLNWSSPRDAFWSLNKNFCETLSDVYILLKSSDFISHDLNHPFDDCEGDRTESAANLKYYFVARRWASLNPMMEFRCFVKDNKLIGISQRECRSFYQHLVDNKAAILSQIENYYLENIFNKFLDKTFTFDIYLDKNKVKLVDFNPFGKRTDSLLYSWDELNSDVLMDGEDGVGHKSDKLELRVIDTQSGVQPSEMSMYGCPLESIAMQNFVYSDLAKLVQNNATLHDDSSDEDNVE